MHLRQQFCRNRGQCPLAGNNTCPKIKPRKCPQPHAQDTHCQTHIIIIIIIITCIYNAPFPKDTKRRYEQYSNNLSIIKHHGNRYSLITPSLRRPCIHAIFFSTACRTACKHAFCFLRVFPEAVSTRHSWL